MTTTTTTTTTATDAGIGTVPAVATTRRLLGCAAVAGPLFVATFVLQALTRDGYDITQHPLSLLSLGAYGWIQVANFMISGALFVAGAVGLRRAMAGGRGSRWAPRLIGTFGVALIVGGGFAADPVDGYPVGATAPADPSWHSMVHSMAPAIAFLSLSAACFVFARHFAQRGDRGHAIASVVVGLAMFAPDALLGTDGFLVAVAAAISVGWCWVSYVAFHVARELELIGDAR